VNYFWGYKYGYILAWLGVHLALLSGGAEKSATFVDWGWTLFTRKRGKRIILGDEDVEAALRGT
jgi:hypothetical protein